MTGAPSSSTRPASGSIRPASSDTSVVLPLPEKPTMATSSPAPIAKSTSCSTSMRAEALRRRRAVRGTGSGCHGSPRAAAAIMTRSRAKPMLPIVSTATRMRASESLLPFWKLSHTNFPRPGFWASISAAIKHHPADAEREPQPREDPRQRGRQHDLRHLHVPRQPQHARDVPVIAVDRRDAERGVDERRATASRARR